jgi:hypothetical protein
MAHRHHRRPGRLTLPQRTARLIARHIPFFCYALITFGGMGYALLQVTRAAS